MSRSNFQSAILFVLQKTGKGTMYVGYMLPTALEVPSKAHERIADQSVVIAKLDVVSTSNEV
jgi:hypothetical protein